ncbi:MAG: argininosuccinate lyase [Candidatus Omnitrophota bacterium]
MGKKMWGGRFTKETNPLVEEFTKSIHFDRKLAEYDCMGSLLHIEVLKKAGILSDKEYEELKGGLESILNDMRKGVFKIGKDHEDIHSYIQALIEKKVGKASHKLHTARSRNDQVAFDMKFYCLTNSMFTVELIIGLCKELEKASKKYKGQVMPGYTHLQHAMPIEISNYFNAYLEMFLRDSKRLLNAANNINLTLGSGSIAGTFISAEYYNVSGDIMPGGKKIGPSPNSIDSVSDRDFIIEILSAISIIGMHLSRMSEDMILFSTSEFSFIEIDDEFCTGSSLMPQKKNPDVLELIRGYAGRLYANLVEVLVVMKGLPLSYNRDMQLDKEPLFSSFEIIQSELKIMAELLSKIKFNKAALDKQLEDETLYATDIADYLVKKGVTFRDAHDVVGKLVHHKLASGKAILKMSADELKKIHPYLKNSKLKNIIDPKKSVASKKSSIRK